MTNREQLQALLDGKTLVCGDKRITLGVQTFVEIPPELANFELCEYQVEALIETSPYWVCGDELGILSQVGPFELALISHEGMNVFNRQRESVTVKDINKITKQEFKNIFGNDNWHVITKEEFCRRLAGK